MTSKESKSDIESYFSLIVNAPRLVVATELLVSQTHILNFSEFKDSN